MFNPFLGLAKLTQSRKATLSLIIFIASLVALFCNKLDGLAFAGIVSTIAVIYNYSQHRVDIASLKGNDQ